MLTKNNNMPFDFTAIFTAVSNFFAFTENLSPAILDWLEAKIPAEKQHVMAARIRRCKRICRRQKLTAPLIADEVKLLFADLPLEQQTDITGLLCFELGEG
jgi:hypothetical protein